MRALAKPTVVPWAVNHVYWHARPVFDRVIKTGERLRAAQIASLEGRRADVRAAGDTHREAIGAAVKEAERLARDSGSQPALDALMRTFEALSLATEPPEPHGRLTKALQPSGFEALAGVQVKEPSSRAKASPSVARAFEAREPGAPERAALHHAAPTKREAEAEGKRERAEREAARRHEAAVKSAEAALARAEAAESQARTAWERAHDDLLKARQTLRSVKSEV